MRERAAVGMEAHTEHTEEWIRVADVRPGDRIRVPGFSSWAGWATREDAERSEQPFRRVVEIEMGWEGTSRTRFVFASGGACQLPPDAFVLRAG